MYNEHLSITCLLRDYTVICLSKRAAFPPPHPPGKQNFIDSYMQFKKKDLMTIIAVRDAWHIPPGILLLKQTSNMSYSSVVKANFPFLASSF